MKFKYVYILLLLIILNCAMNEFVMAQYAQSKINMIEDDIEILEAVLDRMFFRNNTKLAFYRDRTSGYYLDEYGFLFKIPYSMNYSYFNNENFRNLIKAYSDPDKMLEAINTLPETDAMPDMKLIQDKEIATIRRTIDKFMSDYIATMSYASPAFWINVVVDLKQESWLMNLGDEDLTHQIIARVQIKNINDFRAGKLDRDEFIRKIKYDYKKNGQDNEREEIEIFTEIVESSLIKKSDDSFRLTNRINGFHIDDYGLIFMADVDMIPNFINIITKSQGNQTVSISQFTTSSDSVFDLNEKLDLLEEKIVSIISRYGHTVNSLKENESIEFAFNLNTPSISESASKVVYKVKKSDIDKYNHKKIDYNEFKERFEINRY